MGKSDDVQARIAGLEAQMTDIISRLAALERAASPHAVTAQGTGKAAEPAGERGDDAVVTYAGDGQFGPGKMAIRQRKTLREVLSVSPESIAPVFGGLASPARIALLYALIDGPRTSQELREVLDAGSVGQLYHHLRELLAAGLVVQPARSVYQIPPNKIVAVCVAVSAAEQLMSASHQASPPAGLPEDREPPGEGGRRVT